MLTQSFPGTLRYAGDTLMEPVAPMPCIATSKGPFD